MEEGEEKERQRFGRSEPPSLWTGILGNARWRRTGRARERGLGGEVCGKAAKRLLFENRGR